METTTTTYYTPELEEFHIGFEYEHYEDYDTLSKPVWHKQTFIFPFFNPESTCFVSQNSIDTEIIRVKYLDKEDIEGLGFKEAEFQEEGSPTIVNGYGEVVFVKNIFELKRGDHYYEVLAWLLPQFPTIAIYWNKTQVYSGTCKNKSKLKSILKDVGIV